MMHNLIMPPNLPWDPVSWDVWLRWVAEGARCSYCSLDGQVLGNWRQMNTEHIIPSGSWDPLNLTVACHGCNQVKDNWNPATERRGYNPTTDGLPAPPDEATRQRLIDVARRYVQQQWDTGLWTAKIHARQMAEGRGR
jgi:hypothetical protein